MITIGGQIQVIPPISPTHSSFTHQLNQSADEGQPIVRVECYELPPLTNEKGDRTVDAVEMSMECFIQQRLKPVQTIRARFHEVDQSGWNYSYQFHHLKPDHRYHVISYTIPDDDATTPMIGYSKPQTQAFGFYSHHTNGDRWPWSVIQTTKNSPPPTFSFKLHLPHSFDFLKQPQDEATNPNAPPRDTTHARLSLLKDSMIPVLKYQACTPVERGYAHGFLLAPFILDFHRFYLVEYRFSGNITNYTKFVQEWVDPQINFFSYPTDALEEARGIVAGMKASGISLFIPELERDYDYRDVLSGYIETRTVIAGRSPTVIAAAAAATSSSSSTESSNLLSHNCSQVVLYGQQTSNGSVLAGRNMDGEIDLRKVTATHTVLFATERDPIDSSSTSSSSSVSSSPSFRTISCMWPGLLGTLTGVNETGLYLCENAGPTQPDTGLVSGLTPVAVIQQEALRRLDGRTLTIEQMKQFLQPFISKSGWNSQTKQRTSDEDRLCELKQAQVPTYASDTDGGFSGPGSLFVIALPPSSAASTSSDSTAPSSSSSEPVAASSLHGFVVECDRSHTSFRSPGVAPPFLPDCILATNHFLKLGFDDQDTLSREREYQRAPIPSSEKCTTLHMTYAGSAATSRMTNWDEPLNCSTHWRFEAGRNRLQAWSRQNRRCQMKDLQELLQVCCPAYTEHSFACELQTNGRVMVHIAVADGRVGFWDAPYSPWYSFEFNELFESVPHPSSPTRLVGIELNPGSTIVQRSSHSRLLRVLICHLTLLLSISFTCCTWVTAVAPGEFVWNSQSEKFEWRMMVPRPLTSSSTGTAGSEVDDDSFQRTSFSWKDLQLQYLEYSSLFNLLYFCVGCFIFRKILQRWSPRALTQESTQLLFFDLLWIGLLLTLSLVYYPRPYVFTIVILILPISFLIRSPIRLLLLPCVFVIGLSVLATCVTIWKFGLSFLVRVLFCWNEVALLDPDAWICQSSSNDGWYGPIGQYSSYLGSTSIYLILSLLIGNWSIKGMNYVLSYYELCDRSPDDLTPPTTTNRMINIFSSTMSRLHRSWNQCHCCRLVSRPSETNMNVSLTLPVDSSSMIQSTHHHLPSSIILHQDDRPYLSTSTTEVSQTVLSREPFLRTAVTSHMVPVSALVDMELVDVASPNSIHPPAPSLFYPSATAPIEASSSTNGDIV